ncbi:MAG: hypothetical protein HRT58_20150 [Crocinitomicaceae bacterium]|nr:hypothetical protein [Flavobacteriales bacterium]NQZ37983.1 hypothetical protein [Crocinitomicaceae bacterium]
MNGYQQLKKQLLPLVKGLPIVVVVFIASIIVGKLIIRYSSNQFQSIAKIKLDDQKFGFSSNETYKDFEMFTLTNRIDAEAELLKSPLIIEKAIDMLKMNVNITRIGRLKNSIIYGDSPINVNVIDSKHSEEVEFELEIISEKNFVVTLGEKSKKGIFGENLRVGGMSLIINKEEQEPGNKIDLIGNYLVEILSKQQMIQEISKHLDVTSLDKETPILRVVYTDGDPRKTADIANAICQAYIDDYVITKSSSASLTVEFIEEQLQDIGRKLKSSEGKLESFKTKNNVVNTRQETETGLREISQLRIDMINLDINEKAMRDLQGYMEKGEYFNETAVNFGFGDLVLTELVKKLKYLNDQRIDISVKFTESSEEIIGVDKKIGEIKSYIKEAVNRNLSDVNIRRTEIQRAYETQSHMFDRLPTREKNQHILERDFMINESVYNFLSQKKIDASILANSMISFHRIIQPAVAAKEPTSPNHTLIKFVSGLFGLILAIGFIYGRQYVSAKVSAREDIERNSELPIAGIIRKDDKDEDFDMLFRCLLLKHKLNSGSIISISSALQYEGKNYMTEYLSKTIRAQGYSCEVITFNTEDAGSLNSTVISRDDPKCDERVRKIAAKNDFTLVKTPPTTRDVFAIQVIRNSDLCLFLIRANHTAINFIQEADVLVQEYGIDNIQIVLNSAHKATNFTGYYVGTRFRSGQSNKGIVQRIKKYYQLYVRS